MLRKRFFFKKSKPNPAPPSNPVLYQPLDASRNEIRLLSVHGGQFDDPIQCTIDTISLGFRPGLYEYEALSYVWGDPNRRDTITLQGAIPVSVTTNLFSALQYLRRPDRPRVIWVDAVCINQEDLQERGQQVTLMSLIYQKASRCVAWLGEDSEDCRMAFFAFREWAKNGELHWDPGLTPTAPDLRVQYARAVRRLLERPWWHRVWTLQETIRPVQIDFLFGKNQVSSESMFQASQNSFRHVLSPCCWNHARHHDGALLEAEKLHDSMETIYNLSEARKKFVLMEMLDWMIDHTSRQCTDPRDKVYGMLGVTAVRHLNSIEPDYRKSISQVYEEFTLRLIGFYGNLDFLSLFPQRHLSTDTTCITGLPSWVPNWSSCDLSEEAKVIIKRVAKSELYKASGVTHANPRTLGEGRIAVPGIIIAELAQLGKPMNSIHEIRSDAVYQDWRQLAQVDVDPNRPYPDLPSGPDMASKSDTSKKGGVDGACTYQNAYEMTLCSSIRTRVRQSTVRRKDYEVCRTLHDLWWTYFVNTAESVLGSLDPGLTTRVYLYISDILSSTIGRRLFLTSDPIGLMGLAPEDAEAGDMIAVLHGANVPFIIRKAGQTENGEACWKLVGDSYVHGMMDGEAVSLGKVQDIILT